MLRLKIILQYSAIYYILLVISFILSLVRIHFFQYESKYSLNDKEITGIITNIKRDKNNYTLIIKAQEKVKVYYYGNEKLTLGMKIKITGNFFEPINNTIPNTFNYKKYLNNHKIYFNVKAKEVIILERNRNLIYSIKNKLYQKCLKNTKTYNYLNAFILGDTANIERETYEEYQSNGITHLFAISGSQINLIALLTFNGLKKVKIKEVSKYLIVIFLLIFLCLIINSSASILRSLIFFILLSLNKLFDLKISTKNILFTTVIILLILNPLIIYDIGFQYSVVVTYGLIISSKKKKVSYFKSLMYTSFIATLFSMPITLINYYEINLLSPVNNLIFVPLITFIIYPLSILTIFLNIFEPILYLFIEMMEYLNFLLFNINLFKIIIPKVNNMLFIIYYGLIIIYIYSLNRKYLLISLLLILSFKIKPLFNNKTYVYFLDVGQGDSCLIYHKKEKILIDTGGVYNYKISNNTILFMKSLGISKLDLLLLTHGDSDHLGDATNILNKMKVNKVMINSNDYNDLEIEILNFKNIKIVDKYQGFLDFKIYNQYKNNDENASSIISLLTINNNKILFMGDATQEQEKLFIKEYNIQANIIKLGHHGSRTSSNKGFLKKLNLKEAIISSGRNNRFNHPHQETIDTLEILNIKYYNTQNFGTIKYVFGQSNYTKSFNYP